jgi:hypothetical protein
MREVGTVEVGSKFGVEAKENARQKGCLNELRTIREKRLPVTLKF